MSNPADDLIAAERLLAAYLHEGVNLESGVSVRHALARLSESRLPHPTRLARLLVLCEQALHRCPEEALRAARRKAEEIVEYERTRRAPA